MFENALKNFKKLFTRAKKFDQNRIDSLISLSMTVDGNITYAGSLIVHGKITGSLNKLVDAGGVFGIIIEKTGEIITDTLTADFVINRGKLTCTSMIVDELLTLEANSVTKSESIEYGELKVESGAITAGNFTSKKL